MLRLGLPAAGRMKKLWREHRPDLVHVATEGPLGSSAITAAGALGIPATSSFHTNFHAYAGHYGFAPLRRIALAWLRRVHNPYAADFRPDSRALRRGLEALGFRRMALLSRGVDTRQFSPSRRSPKVRLALGILPDNPVVIHAGRLAREKDYPLLFKIYAAMRQANPRLRFVLVGDGPLDRKLRAEHRDCIFTGFISRQELARHYASADIYIHASRTEGDLRQCVGRGDGERSLAVAGFDYAAAKQFVRNGENGLSVPFDQPDALVAAAVRLATDAALRDRFGNAATEAVALHSWDHVIALFEADFDSGGEPSRPARPRCFRRWKPSLERHALLPRLEPPPVRDRGAPPICPCPLERPRARPKP